MAHRIIFARANGGVSIHDGGKKRTAMMADGGLRPGVERPLSDPHRAYMENLAATDPAVQALLDHEASRPLIELDYEISKSVGIDHIPEAIVRPMYEAEAFGGLTEAEALQVMADYIACVVAIQVSPVLSHHVVEEEDLPTNSYFRDAWEWEE